MTTSEPTTGELIEALRCDGVIKPCEGCFFAFQIENCSAMGCRTDDMFGLAADRLESQEQTIAALTARAEQAEAREKAAVKDLAIYGKNAHTCKHSNDCQSTDTTHESCHDCELWAYRGQPQDGDGEE